MSVNQIVEELKKSIVSFEKQVEVEEVGKVLEIGDGIARLSGLLKCQASEMLEFPGNTYGVALNLENETIGAVVLGDFKHIKEGDVVKRTGRILSVPVGDELIGRIVNTLGQPIDGGAPIKSKKFYPVEKIAPGVMTRESVTQPVQTGIKAIDAMIPIGRGQRELIIGDRQTGKTAVAIDTIMVNKDVHLAQISEVMGIPYGELRALNPQYRTGLVPGSSRPFSLTLPMTHLGDFIDLNDTIRRYKPDVYLNKSTQIADPTRSSYLPADVKGKTKLIYTVQEGDNLGFISEWYRVSLSDLRYWNNIYRNTIRIGQKLVVYVDPAKSEYFSKISTMTFAEKQQLAGKTVPVNSGATVASGTSYETEGEYVVHTVRNGDTIWDIVKMYDNVTSTQVLSLNNISDPGKIQVGQKLKIKKKS